MYIYIYIYLQNSLLEVAFFDFFVVEIHAISTHSCTL